MSAPSPIKRWLTIAVTSAAGALALWSGWLMAFAIHTRSWPSTEGEILYSKVEVSGKKVGEHDDRLRWPSHVADIVYRYNAPQGEYRGDRIYYRDLSTTVREAESLAGLFSQGQRVTVRYNPADSGESVLISGASSAMVRVFSGSLFTFLLGLFFSRKKPHRH